MAGRRRYLVTGGAGFIGTNAASRLISAGHRVVILDNLSRPGVGDNLDWLAQLHGHGAFDLVRGDVEDADLVAFHVRDAEVVLHLAGQVAVTTSVDKPRADFLSNAVGTLNVLEGARLAPTPPIVIYSSTNKVYGDLGDLALEEDASRYRLVGSDGIDETRPVDPISPYGCSKCVGDLYARDYHRIYGLRTVVFRQSCIYGPRQLGLEDQGWLAWMTFAAMSGRQLSIFGNGKQVRDVLWIDDLLQAYDLAVERIDQVAGTVLNIGGGPGNTLSVWSELGPLLSEELGRPLSVRYHDWRPGDQRFFVADISLAGRLLGWQPRVGVAEGVRRLAQWISGHIDLLEAHCP
jgi:CDP-paratose 2-epimerase